MNVSAGPRLAQMVRDEEVEQRIVVKRAGERDDRRVHVGRAQALDVISRRTAVTLG